MGIRQTPGGRRTPVTVVASPTNLSWVIAIKFDTSISESPSGFLTCHVDVFHRTGDGAND